MCALSSYHGGFGGLARRRLADPILQGLAISLMAGEIASLLISRMAVPVLYFMAYSRKPAAKVSTGRSCEEPARFARP
jgi:hypothetical protein